MPRDGTVLSQREVSVPARTDSDPEYTVRVTRPMFSCEFSIDVEESFRIYSRSLSSTLVAAIAISSKVLVAKYDTPLQVLFILVSAM